MTTDHEKRLIGLRIRRLREARGQTQHALAVKAGVSLKHLGELERGRGNPSLRSFQGLAGALGLSLYELLNTEQQGKSDDVLRADIRKWLHAASPDVVRLIHKALKP